MLMVDLISNKNPEANKNRRYHNVCCRTIYRSAVLHALKLQV
jgi:hypothetical protein